ncbi:endonuclease/exonuclease/phosphatase family protein [Verrucomicrobiota bacterium]
MRFLLYNIRYGTGGGRMWFPWSGYLRRTSHNLHQMADFVASLDPDIVGLLEVDEGSYRTGRKSQAKMLANVLGHYHTYGSKYGEYSLARRIPVLNRQGNAFLTRDTITNDQFHYFDKGVKRLVIELELDRVVIFLVHLALSFRIRHHQLSDLYSLVKNTAKPHIVAGDFNALWGDREIRLFLAATDLRSANDERLPSFPSWAPRRQLDFVLHSAGIESRRLWMPRVTYSDHLPIVYDFGVNGNGC